MPGMFVPCGWRQRPEQCAAGAGDGHRQRSEQALRLRGRWPNDKADYREVAAGPGGGRQAILTSGLNPGDRVIVRRLAESAPGALVIRGLSAAIWRHLTA